jgi:VWFA-related protein
MLSRVLFATRTLAVALLVPITALPQEQPPIQVSVNEVIVPVTVTDDKGRFVTNLDEREFHIFDEGKPQKISYFTRDRSQPVVVGFLIDMSNGMKIQWKKYQDAVTELVQNLLPGDPKYAGYLISYGNMAQLEVDTTSDPEAMVAKIASMKPAGGSALYDAVYAACTTRKLVHGEPFEPRRVLVVIGDGHDTASKHSLAEVLEVAQRNLVTIYGMSTVSFGFAAEGDENLKRLAEDTGGRVVYPLNDLYKDISGYLSKPSDDGNYALTVGTGAYAGEVSSGIYHAVSDIVGEITTQYILRYIPDAAANEKEKVFHNLKVQVDLATVKVRYRKGYFPSNQPRDQISTQQAPKSNL